MGAMRDDRLQEAPHRPALQAQRLSSSPECWPRKSLKSVPEIETRTGAASHARARSCEDAAPPYGPLTGRCSAGAWAFILAWLSAVFSQACRAMTASAA